MSFFCSSGCCPIILDYSLPSPLLHTHTHAHKHARTQAHYGKLYRLSTNFSYKEWLSYRIVGEEKVNLCSNIWHNVNGKINTIITLSKWSENHQSFLFKKKHPYTILPPPFHKLLHSPLQGKQLNSLRFPYKVWVRMIVWM